MTNSSGLMPRRSRIRRYESTFFSLTTSIQAVAEGNFGRLGAGQQQRYTDANAETMFSEPATGNNTSTATTTVTP